VTKTGSCRRDRLVLLLLAVLATGLPVVVASPAAAATPVTEAVSVDPLGLPGTGQPPAGNSMSPAISADGRYVAFDSRVPLTPDDTNGTIDVFVRDRQAGATERVSVDNAGQQLPADSGAAAISADGRYVAFSSTAQIVPADVARAGDYPNSDVYVRDRLRGTTELISVSPNSGQSGGYSQEPSITPDGRYVAFTSGASDLVASDTNGVRDVFVYDRQATTTERVSLADDGAQANDTNGALGGPGLSADGRYVAFTSQASNLVLGDTNGLNDAFVRDRAAGRTERVGVTSDGGQFVAGCEGNALSASGREAIFTCNDGAGRYGVYLRDRQRGTTELESVDMFGPVGSDAVSGSISPDGRFVSFRTSYQDSGRNYWQQIFFRDRQLRSTQLVTRALDGGFGNRYSYRSVLSADDRWVAFDSGASNLVPNDTPDTFDVFVRGPLVDPDTTPPTVTGTPDRPAVNGWYSADVTITWAANDSPPSSGTPTTPPQTVAALEGKDVTYASSPSCDPAGNCGTGSLVLSIDKTPPTATLPVPQDGASYTVGQAVAAHYGCQDEAGGSGIASCVGTVDGTTAIADSAPIPTSSVGGHALTVTATDTAGNRAVVTRTYTVFGGLSGPVDPLPTVNTGNAGAGVPIVFSLPGNQGLGLFEVGYPKSQSVSCETFAGSPSDPIESTVSTPAGLTYNAATDQYTYVWKTDRAWAGSCRRLLVKFAPSVPAYGGSQVLFNFKFK
jgi:Tol biopolymer transport system component